MNRMKLSKRLQYVASYIEKGMSIADIGTDHAYLPCYVISQGISPFAVAGDVVDGPYQSALRQVAQSGLTDKLKVRKGNGLDVIQPGEVECIVIAGMGGTLITDILMDGHEKLTEINRLILQPNIAADNVRRWLWNNNWNIVAEELIEEDGKFYEIIAAEPNKGKKVHMTEKEILLGPYLLKKKHAAFQKKWQQELKQWENVLRQLEQASETDKIVDKRQEIQQKMSIVQEVLK